MIEVRRFVCGRARAWVRRPPHNAWSEWWLVLVYHDRSAGRFAAEAAHRAAPDDDQAKLDLIAVAAREGHGDTAALQLLDAIGSTSEDYRSPIDPSERTKEIIAKLRTSAGWSSRSRR